jgi:PadR family transcriptional regulator PadR
VPDASSDVVQGTVDMLVLKTLSLEPLHGYGIGVRIEQMSKGVFRVNAGTLFPAFCRLERRGLVKTEWKATENNRRAKYYTLTEAGRKKLKAETLEWTQQTQAIARIMAKS